MKFLACVLLLSAPAFCGTFSFPVTYIWNNGVLATATYYTSDGGNFIPSTANSINDSGTVVGGITGDMWVPYAGTWNGVNTTTLPSLVGYTRGNAEAINNAGVIVGESYNDGITKEPTEWIDSQPIDLGVSSGFSQGDAGGINDTDEAVGLQFTRSGLEAATLWANGKVTPLSSPSGYSQATAINDSGVIVGGVGSQPVAWIDGIMSALPCRAGGDAFDINNSDMAVGICGNEAALWDVATGKMTDLGPGLAQGINNAGVVVGRTGTNASSTVAEHAFVWSAENGMQILPGFAWSDAFAINDNGSILGYGQLSGDNSTGPPITNPTPPTNTDPEDGPPPTITGSTPDISEPGNLTLVGLLALIAYSFRQRFSAIRYRR